MGWEQAAGAGLGILGGLFGAKGAVDTGEAKAKAARYRGQVAKNNATINRQQGEYAVESGEARSTLESLRGADLQGKIKANQGASGVDVNSGSNVSVRAGARQASKLNADTVLSNAQLLNYGYLARAANAEAEAGLSEMEADAATKAGNINAASSLLGSISQLPLKWGGIGGGGGAAAKSGTGEAAGALAGEAATQAGGAAAGAGIDAEIAEWAAMALL